MTIGEIICQYRAEHNLSMRKFALKCGLSNGYIGMLERGVNPNTGEPIIPNLRTLQSLAKGLDMTLDDLIKSADESTLVSLEDGNNNSNTHLSIKPDDPPDGIDLGLAYSVILKRAKAAYIENGATEDEANDLTELTNILWQFRGTPEFEEAQKHLQQLRKKSHRKKKDN